MDPDDWANGDDNVIQIISEGFDVCNCRVFVLRIFGRKIAAWSVK
ncbi:hypothetical protein [Gluconobacter oxydans]|nr:hypothetical protein [Gluconobacter oxydans]